MYVESRLHKNSQRGPHFVTFVFNHLSSVTICSTLDKWEELSVNPERNGNRKWKLERRRSSKNSSNEFLWWVPSINKLNSTIKTGNRFKRYLFFFFFLITTGTDSESLFVFFIFTYYSQTLCWLPGLFIDRYPVMVVANISNTQTAPAQIQIQKS